MKMRKTCLLAVAWIALALSASEFSPQTGTVAEVERPYRAEICLNGRWKFQPMPLPPGYEWNKGIVPELPLPAPDKWESVPVKVPSPWNVNTWGCGSAVGEGTVRPYDPDSVYYPSYPEAWRHVRMAWLERSFELPGAVDDASRYLLHFEAVAGACRVRVNGRDVGTHFDSYLPFDLDVTTVLRPGTNVVQVGIRDHKLWDRKEPQYPYMAAPYPTGSNTDGLNGIWQDVSLVRVPAVRVRDAFVKACVSSDRLELELTLANARGTAACVTPTVVVSDWQSEVSGDPMRVEEPRWHLGETRLSGKAETVEVPANGETKVTLALSVKGALKLWSPSAPNLSAAVITLAEGNTTLDRKYVRFGWREFTLKGRDLLLNGERIELKGDILHPFGPYAFSTRFVRAWYTMIKEMHGNAVRPHAQIYPRCYLDLADEMGLCVLDEVAVFGSSIRCNFTVPEFWTRWEDHYRGLVFRDRNHPSVFGWSFGNEMFAIFRLNEVPDGPEKTAWYGRIAEIGLKAREWDPTRAWISCDGDADLDGRLPVWSKHYGHHPRDMEAEARGIDKPLMVGENGGTYYARPSDLVRLGGEAAYRDYAGRNEALAVDVYSNYVAMARGRLAYFSASETAWFGLEPLPLGLKDTTRVPRRTDGVFFADVPDGTWGPQVERLPPYVTTFNPGFDQSLPLYRPLTMFTAQQAAQDPRGPQPCRWDRYPPSIARTAPPADVEPGANELVFIADDEDLARVNARFGLALRREARSATQLVRASETDPAVASLTADDLYFAEAGETPASRQIVRHVLCGAPEASVLLLPSNTDWSLFNRCPENAKVSAVVCYEKTAKVEGAALLALPSARGRVFVTTISREQETEKGRGFLRRLCANIGVELTGTEGAGTAVTPKAHDLLLDGPTEDPAAFVRPFTGTSYNGHTFPGPAWPFGAVQPSPDTGWTGWEYCSGYRWDDTSALGFSQNHLNGTGCPDFGDFLIQPFVEGREAADFRGHYVRDAQRAEAGYYAVTYTNFNVRAEVTAGERVAHYRFTYLDGGRAAVLLDTQHGIGWDAEKRVLESVIEDDGATRVWGRQRRAGWVTRATAFALAFDRPYAARRVLPKRAPGERGERIVYTFDLKPGERLGVRIALSGRDAEGARRNLAADPSETFDEARARVRAAWNEALSVLSVTGDAEQKANVYTALYHACLQPNRISDVDEPAQYSTFSCWDTFRAAGPLYTILYPDKAAAFVDSMLAQGRKTGYLPIWTLAGEENQCMIGTHSVPMIVDWFLKSGAMGTSPDWNAAYLQIKETLTRNHAGRTKESWNLYDRYGYYPFDMITGESVSRTMECAYDDWCAAQMAKALGKDEDCAFFAKRAANWKNVFDPTIGFVRGKDSAGRWREPFSPFALGHDELRANDFTEGNSWHYTWHVMQDPEGLVAALGGRERFAEKLASLFEQPEQTAESGFVADATGLIGQYAHGNEPSHHTIYLFQYAGRPDLTARYVREVFDRFYHPRPDGLCGNDDCGQMSAWHVFGAMGFYPLNPCGGEYVIGAPQVEKVTLRCTPTPNTCAAFTIIAKNLTKENRYVKSVTLNGKPLKGFVLRHADILAGGELVFEMTDVPRTDVP